MENPQELLARLRGEETPVRQPPAHQRPEVRDSFTSDEVRALIQPLVSRMDSLETMVGRLATSLEAIPAMIEREVQRSLPAALAERLDRPVDPGAEFPDADRITKLQVQYFHNPDQKKNEKKPLHLLKVYVWTCPISDVDRYPEGTCGHKWIPLYQPCTALARKRFGTTLDYLNAQDADLFGCLTPSKYTKRPKQAAVILPERHLLLNVRGTGFDLKTPKPQRDGARDRASLHTWYWPETAA